MNRSYGLYSVVRSDSKWNLTVVETGLEYPAAKQRCQELEAEYKNAVLASGKHYSTWTADLYHCQLES